MTVKNKPEVIFEQGCFDQFDRTQEELNEFIAEIKRMAESGELLENSQIITDESWEDLEDGEKKIIIDSIGQNKTARNLH